MAVSPVKQVYPSSTPNPESIMFIYNGYRCHAVVVDKLSIEPNWRNYIGRYDVGTKRKPLEFDVYKVADNDPWGFEAVPADAESERDKEARLHEAHTTDFYKNTVLSHVSDEELLAELQRRGYQV